MIDLKCTECGCTIPPDAIKCPNCGYKYAEVKPPVKSNGHGITVGRIGYAITCPDHGKIHITAGVPSALPSARFAETFIKIQIDRGRRSKLLSTKYLLLRERHLRMF